MKKLVEILRPYIGQRIAVSIRCEKNRFEGEESEVVPVDLPEETIVLVLKQIHFGGSLFIIEGSGISEGTKYYLPVRCHGSGIVRYGVWGFTETYSIQKICSAERISMGQLICNCSSVDCKEVFLGAVVPPSEESGSYSAQAGYYDNKPYEMVFNPPKSPKEILKGTRPLRTKKQSRSF